MNIYAILVAALVPMIMGTIWYSPKVLGNAWMKSSGITEEKIKAAHIPMVYILSLVFSFLLSFEMQFLVVHQFHIGSAFFDYNEQIKSATTSEGAIYKSVMDLVGTGHRTFGHGAFHGTIAGFFIALPILATNSMFENKGFKYIAINAGYWIITLAIMGGILSVWM